MRCLSQRSVPLSLAVLLVFLMASCGDDNDTTKPPVTPSTDEIAPAAIVDLTIVSVTDESVRLTWTAPGDDDTTGTAASYSLRYATAMLTDENWMAATEVVTAPPPDSSGTNQTFTVTGLSDRTTYYFGLKTADEVPNWSALSNVATETTPAGPAPDGSWSPLGTGTYDPINALEVYQEDLFIGGRFSSAGDLDAFNIARWDGFTWSPLGSGTDKEVRCLDVYDGDLIVAGYIRKAGDVPVRLIARWDGADWDSLGSGLIASGRSFVLEMTVCENHLVAGGNINMVEGYHMAGWDGVKWSRFANGEGTMIEALTVHKGELVASGQFGAGAGVVLRWDGAEWISLETGLLLPAYDLLTYDGDLIVAGRFGEIGGVEAQNIARWDGTAWHPLGSGLGGYSAVCLEIFDGDLIVGGYFTEAGGVPVRNIARWNGSEWYPVGSGANGRINDLVVWDGALIAAGEFFEAGGVVVNHIARWDDHISP